LRNKVAYVSQDVDLRPIVVSDYITEIYNYKYNKHLLYDQSQIEALFNYFELELSLQDKNVKDLSGGERQRLGIIIAFLLNREILLLDEVTSGLDVDLKQKVLEYIKKISVTAIIISHDEIWMDDQIKVVSW